MLLNNTEVESSVCNCAYVCACCSVGSLQSCCCYSYHPSQEQIACKNKRSHFRPKGRELSERMQFGCILLSVAAVECLQIEILRFYFWKMDLGEVKNHIREQTRVDLSLMLLCGSFLCQSEVKAMNSRTVSIIKNLLKVFTTL